MTYMAIIDKQNGGFMHTGRNTTTLNELKGALLEYYGSDHPDIDDGDGLVGLDKLSTMTVDELLDYGEFELESSNIPFDDNSKPMDIN